MEQIILLNAIAVFEKQFHCSLCLHDFTGRLAAGILPSYHLNPFCTKVKRGRRKTELRCVAFDCGVVQEQLIRRPAFFLKQCACGFIEGVFPVMTGEKLCGCIFAGPFAAAKERNPAELLLKEKIRGVSAENLPNLPRSLRAFQAYGELIAAAVAEASAEREGSMENERERIEHFLEREYVRNIGLEDAARLLELSPARASGRIHRIFGKGFCELLREQRLSAAKRLLARSSFTVEKIAQRCGFRDGAYFHRVFRRTCGLSPLEYRRRHPIRES